MFFSLYTLVSFKWQEIQLKSPDIFCLLIVWVVETRLHVSQTKYGVSTNVLVLKTAISTFFGVLESALDHLSGKVLVLMLKHVLLKVLMKYN